MNTIITENWNVWSFHRAKFTVSLLAEFTNKLETACSTVPVIKTGREGQVEN